MRRGLATGSGLVLIAIAFLAATNVADTREGLIAEIVTLMSGLAGVGLLLYGLVPKRPAAGQSTRAASARGFITGPRLANDLVIGAAGLLLAAVLLTGLGISAGWFWAALGAVMLLPMIAGSAYLVAAFIRAPKREWRIDFRRLLPR